MNEQQAIELAERKARVHGLVHYVVATGVKFNDGYDICKGEELSYVLDMWNVGMSAIVHKTEYRGVKYGERFL